MKDYLLIKGDYFEQKLPIRVRFKSGEVATGLPPTRSLSGDRRRRSVTSQRERSSSKNRNLAEEPVKVGNFVRDVGLLEVENSDLKRKLQNAEMDILDAEKKLNEVRFETNDLQLRLDETIGQLKEKDDRITNLERSLSKYKDSIDLKFPSSNFTLYYEKLKQLLQSSSPEIEEAVSLAVALEKRRSSELESKLKKIERDDSITDNGRIKGNTVGLVDSGANLHHYISELEDRVLNLENEKKINMVELTKLRENLTDLHRGRNQDREEVGLFKKELGGATMDKLAAQILSDENTKNFEYERQMRRKIQDKNNYLSTNTTKLETELEITQEECSNLRLKKNQVENDYDTLLRGFTESEYQRKKNQHRLTFAENLALELLQFLAQPRDRMSEFEWKTKKTEFEDQLSELAQGSSSEDQQEDLDSESNYGHDNILLKTREVNRGL